MAILTIFYVNEICWILVFFLRWNKWKKYCNCFYIATKNIYIFSSYNRATILTYLLTFFFWKKKIPRYQKSETTFLKHFPNARLKLRSMIGVEIVNPSNRTIWEKILIPVKQSQLLLSSSERDFFCNISVGNKDKREHLSKKFKGTLNRRALC